MGGAMLSCMIKKTDCYLLQDAYTYSFNNYSSIVWIIRNKSNDTAYFNSVTLTIDNLEYNTGEIRMRARDSSAVP